ncbi:ead/Ea22-like family protein [Pseudomonas sp. FYR_7]|uniref:ead/Ea22-like family protein n=1 Tax=Pseudomonas sp. FYR_7 TaxID=3367174 RepID=UPI00370AC1BE
MTIDKEKLKALAEASGGGEWYSAGDLRYCDDKTGEIHGLHHDDSRFIAAASPATVLALLAEIEWLDRESQNLSNQLGHCDRERRAFRAERDQLKAENEALRKALGDCADELSAEIICKHGGQKPEDMHPVTRRLYERDMAAVTEARAALAKAVSHD